MSEITNGTAPEGDPAAKAAETAAPVPKQQEDPKDDAAPARPILPFAGIRAKASRFWPNLLILALVGIVGAFIARDQFKQGETITVWFTDVHGLRVGSPLEQQGDQTIGEVVAIERPDDLSRCKVVIKLKADPIIADRLRRQGNTFYVARFHNSHASLKGVTNVIRGPSVVVRLGDAKAQFQDEFEGAQFMPPDPRISWNSVRADVHFRDVKGVEPGAEVRDRGLQVGVVETVEAVPNSDYIKVGIAYFETDPAKCTFVRQYTRYYVDTAKLTTKGVEGSVDTVIYGSRIKVVTDPCNRDAPVVAKFTGENSAPPEKLPQLGEKQVVLDSKAWVAPDTILFHMGEEAGYVHSLRPASDSNSFYVSVRIYPSKVDQVREKSVFFFQKKLHAQLRRPGGGILDFDPRIEIPDPQLMLRPAIEFRTPSDSGKKFGYPKQDAPSFPLHAEPKDEWLKWESSIPIEQPEAANVPPPVMPKAVSAKFHWRKAWQPLVSWTKREGLVVPLPGGVLGPNDLLAPTIPEADIRKPVFEIAGAARSRANPTYVLSGSEARYMKVQLEDTVPRVPFEQLMSVSDPVDIWVVTDPDSPKAVAAAKLSKQGETFMVAGDAGFQPSWHGAPVVGRNATTPSYGKVIGVFLVDEKGKSARVALLPADFVAKAKDAAGK